MYTVVGANGEKLKGCKSLSSAKKLADKENGVVLENGKQVYPAITESHTTAETAEAPEATATPSIPELDSEAKEKALVDDVDDVDDAEAVKTVEPIKPAESKSYRLKALMNVRKSPSLKSEIIAHAEANTVVKVIEVKNDWMKVSWYDGFAYILYGSGKFAEAARG